MLLGITVPAYLSIPELALCLEEMVHSVQTTHQFVFVLVENFIAVPYNLNFTVSPERIIKIKPTGQQSVAKGQNLGIRECSKLGCDYILVANIDIALHADCIDQLVAFGERNKDMILWSGFTSTDFATIHNETSDAVRYPCFMVRNDFLNRTQGFDENFITYGFDDIDMYIRLIQSGRQTCAVRAAVFTDLDSQTVKLDKHYAENVRAKQFELNREYLIRKWGSANVPIHWEELYKTPFNDPTKDVDYWERPKNIYYL